MNNLAVCLPGRLSLSHSARSSSVALRKAPTRSWPSADSVPSFSLALYSRYSLRGKDASKKRAFKVGRTRFCDARPYRVPGPRHTGVVYGDRSGDRDPGTKVSSEYAEVSKPEAQVDAYSLLTCE